MQGEDVGDVNCVSAKRHSCGDDDGGGSASLRARDSTILSSEREWLIALPLSLMLAKLCFSLACSAQVQCAHEVGLLNPPFHPAG